MKRSYLFIIMGLIGIDCSLAQSARAEIIKVAELAPRLPIWCSDSTFIATIEVANAPRPRVAHIIYDLQTRQTTELLLDPQQEVVGCSGQAYLIFDSRRRAFWRATTSSEIREPVAMPPGAATDVEFFAVENLAGWVLFGRNVPKPNSQDTSVEYFSIEIGDRIKFVNLSPPGTGDGISWGLPFYWREFNAIGLSGSDFNHPELGLGFVAPLDGSTPRFLHFEIGGIVVDLIAAGKDGLIATGVGPKGQIWALCRLRPKPEPPQCDASINAWGNTDVSRAIAVPGNSGFLVLRPEPDGCLAFASELAATPKCIVQIELFTGPKHETYNISPDGKWFAYFEPVGPTGNSARGAALRVQSLDRP